MGRLALVGIDHLSPSGAATLAACEQQYVGRYRDGMFDPPTEATATGGGFALALEVGSLAAGLGEYIARRPKADPILDDPAEQDRRITIAKSVITHAWSAYVSRFQDVDVEREVTYLVNLRGPDGVLQTDRMLQVRVDGWCHSAGHLIEDKLRAGSSLRQDAIENEVRQGRQLTAEIYAHWRKYDELLPVHLRLVRKPDPRPLKACPIDEIDGLVAAHFEKENVIDERIVRRTVAQLDRWEAEFEQQALRADVLLHGGGQPVRNPSACHAYGRTCPLLPVCQGMTA